MRLKDFRPDALKDMLPDLSFTGGDRLCCRQYALPHSSYKKHVLIRARTVARCLLPADVENAKITQPCFLPSPIHVCHNHACHGKL